LYLRLQVSGLIYYYVFFIFKSRNKKKIWMIAVINPLAISAISAWATVKRWMEAKKSLGKFEREQLFADPLDPCKKIGVGKLTGLFEAEKTVKFLFMTD